MNNKLDQKTADAFATSWNNLPAGSTYTYTQFVDWLAPLSMQDIKGNRVLELGCGNASLLMWITSWQPSYIEGVDLGDSVLSARKNMQLTHFGNFSIVQDDLVTYSSKEKFDLVYCIGVLHHLKEPRKGFDSVLGNTKNGGKFHCWVYSKEGNSFVITFVDPLRRIVSNLPWWFSKYFVATPLAFVFYAYTQFIRKCTTMRFAKKLPMFDYAMWISQRDYFFHRHVAFDQLVTPQTTYISKTTIEEWLQDPRVDKDTTYIIHRNGNSWKFGGIKVSK